MKKILITGGTGGIGSNLVRAFIEDENKIIIWDRNEKSFNELKEKVNNKDNLFFKKIDVTDIDQVKSAAKEIEELDVLINAAAVLWPVKPFLATDLEEVRKSVDISFWGTVYTCYFLSSILKESQHGKIINFSGGGGANGRVDHMAYSIAKTAVVRFTENLSIENPGLNVNAIAPGAHRTPIWNDEKSEEEPEKWGNMDELVNFFRFLISDESDGISGKFINYKDDWGNPDFRKRLKEEPDFLTLRRIDDFQFTRVKK